MSLRRTAVAAIAMISTMFSTTYASANDAMRTDDEPPRRIPHFRLSAGESYGAVFGISSRAWRLEPGVAVSFLRHVGASGAATIDIGETRAGLGTYDVGMYAGVDIELWPVRVSVGPRFSYLWMNRAPSTTLAPVDAIGIGGRASMTIDIVPLRSLSFTSASHAVFIVGAAEADSLRGPSHILSVGRGTFGWRLSAGAGVRF